MVSQIPLYNSPHSNEYSLLRTSLCVDLAVIIAHCNNFTSGLPLPALTSITRSLCLKVITTRTLKEPTIITNNSRKSSSYTYINKVQIIFYNIYYNLQVIHLLTIFKIYYIIYNQYLTFNIIFPTSLTHMCILKHTKFAYFFFPYLCCQRYEITVYNSKFKGRSVIKKVLLYYRMYLIFNFLHHRSRLFEYNKSITLPNAINHYLLYIAFSTIYNYYFYLLTTLKNGSR